MTSTDRFNDQLSALIQSSGVTTTLAKALLEAVRLTGGMEEAAVAHILKVLSSGHLSDEELRGLTDHAPRFVEALRQGLRPLFGPVSDARLSNLARHGNITLSVIERALGHAVRARAA